MPKISTILTLLAITVASAAPAKTILNNKQVDVVEVGGQCFVPPDETFQGRTGEIWMWNDYWPFVFHGDRIPALPGIAFALRLRLHGFEEKAVSVRISHPDGRVDEWEVTVDSQGIMEFGHSPEVNEKLPVGKYHMQVSDHGVNIFAFTVHLEESEEESPCIAMVS